MSKWYGSIENRLLENKPYNKEIVVGTPLTEFMWSDRHPYEVIQVHSQRDIIVRELEHKPIGEPQSNDWELYSDTNKPTKNLVYRYNNWYEKMIGRNGRKYYSKVNISFGYAEYYYDYEF